MIRILGTIFAGLLGLAFGSFLNVCLSRWPAGESVVTPRSHCRNCGRTLTWWENVPLASWLALRGRCRSCHSWIGWRYPLVEAALGGLWGITTWYLCPRMLSPNLSPTAAPLVFIYATGLDIAIGKIIFYWLAVALAVLDAENLWLPNWITLPGIGLGLLFTSSNFVMGDWLAEGPWISLLGTFSTSLIGNGIAILAAAGLILLIRWVYWLIRRREGIGLGDAKLMALLAAWLGLPGALLAFGLGAVLGTLAAAVLLIVPSARRDSESWATSKLPLGTFLCIGGIVSSLWGEPIIAAYLRWAGF
ncbi:MAG: prepilin peptidase [Terracidiphilus sp.]|jgi:leader peptidase (prepilin peptidase)/N-methyltransferase